MTRLCRAKEKILCSCECAKNTFNDTGDNGEGETPVPIPNTAVKPFCAESTELDTTWEGRTLPVTKKETAKTAVSFLVTGIPARRAHNGTPLRRAEQFCSALALRRGTTRRLGRLVCALLRFRERPRTIEVQRTTSSPQNHRKSLAQYCMVLLIQLFRNRLIIWIVFMIAILQRRKSAPFCAVFSGSRLPI